MLPVKQMEVDSKLATINYMLPLPEDILVAIFNVCDPLALARCRSVCKLFNTLILHTSSLQLVIELYLSGLELGKSSLTDSQILSKLRDYNKAWDGLEFVDQGPFNIPRFSFWDRARNTVAFSESLHFGSSKVHIFQIPSTLKNIEYKTWAVGDFTFEINEIKIDASQDLLVLVEIVRGYELIHVLHKYIYAN
jgi:hypothetical protein